MFDDIFDEFDRMFREGRPESGRGIRREKTDTERYSSAAYDAWGKDDKVFVTVELPGAKEKEIEIKTAPFGLIISSDGSKTEKSIGKHYRRIRLPDPIKEKPLQKTFKNGVLEIVFEKDFSRKRSIEVR